ncbi:MAG: hypothetical protein HOP08_08245 [Cyclobacteriaceae bacterium]|nr:hypothetical protein [Cyclobacteriaceae bacterium]
MFQGRTLLIATKHKKERVMAPLLEAHLGVKCIPTCGLDTDLFGTFSGEVDRKEDPLNTLRNKCLKAMELHHADLAVASEGSFGPHPSLVFVSADDELVLLLDAKANFEVMGRELSVSTNFDGSQITTVNQLIDFASHVNFPSHGVITRPSKDDYSGMTKGITGWRVLRKAFQALIKKYGNCYVETDMRALFNPTRMKVIDKATQKLIERVNSCCPACNTPGFGITSVERGLPCSVCKMPTRASKYLIHSCQKCEYVVKYPVASVFEDPRYCDFCNP